jgi:hypothetical protein
MRGIEVSDEGVLHEQPLVHYNGITSPPHGPEGLECCGEEGGGGFPVIDEAFGSAQPVKLKEVSIPYVEVGVDLL